MSKVPPWGKGDHLGEFSTAALYWTRRSWWMFHRNG
jgi:hypothetical protein